MKTIHAIRFSDGSRRILVPGYSYDPSDPESEVSRFEIQTEARLMAMMIGLTLQDIVEVQTEDDGRVVAPAGEAMNMTHPGLRCPIVVWVPSEEPVVVGDL